MKPDKNEKADIAGLYEYKTTCCDKVPDSGTLCDCITMNGGYWEIIGVVPVCPLDPGADRLHKQDIHYVIYMKRIAGGV